MSYECVIHGWTCSSLTLNFEFLFISLTLPESLLESLSSEELDDDNASLVRFFDFLLFLFLPLSADEPSLEALRLCSARLAA